jgi:hypothetical protein
MGCGQIGLVGAGEVREKSLEYYAWRLSDLLAEKDGILWLDSKSAHAGVDFQVQPNQLPGALRQMGGRFYLAESQTVREIRWAIASQRSIGVWPRSRIGHSNPPGAA